MSSLPLGQERRSLTTAIARMLGKAVKLRHCPATVSAPASTGRRMVRAGNQPGYFRIVRKRRTTTAGRPMGSSLGRWLGKAQVRRPVLAPSTRLRSEGNEGAFMPFLAQYCVQLLRAFCLCIAFSCSAACLPACCRRIRGVVTDASGAKVTGATVVADQQREGRWLTPSPSADGSFQIHHRSQGRFFFVVSAKSFRQLETPGFYAGPARQPGAQPGARAGVGARVHRGDRNRYAHAASADQRGDHRAWAAPNLALTQRLGQRVATDAGHSVAQTGQRGSQASLFIRGGDSDATRF